MEQLTILLALDNKDHPRSSVEGDAASQDLLNRLSRFMPVFGITRLANLTGLDRIGIPVAAAYRPNSRALSVSQGKGETLISAKISAFMESVESYHAENIYKPTINISLEDLNERADIIDCFGLARKADTKIKPTEKIMWVEGIDILNQKEVLVPYDAVTTDLTSYNKTSPFIIDSNGLASGASDEASILHGLCEIIERDSLAKFGTGYAEYKIKKIDINTIIDDRNLNLLRKLSDARVLLAVWDITSDMGVPTFFSQIMEADPNNLEKIRPAYGSATHLCKETALFKSITEAAQSRLTFISGARDDQLLSVYKIFDDQKKYNDLIARAKEKSELSFVPLKSYDDLSIDQSISLLISKFETAGLKQVVTVNLSKPEFGIPVFKALVPFMEGISHLSSRMRGPRSEVGIC